eukprot:1412222-Amphidinium_carterae.1
MVLVVGSVFSVLDCVSIPHVAGEHFIQGGSAAGCAAPRSGWAGCHSEVALQTHRREFKTETNIVNPPTPHHPPKPKTIQILVIY